MLKVKRCGARCCATGACLLRLSFPRPLLALCVLRLVAFSSSSSSSSSSRSTMVVVVVVMVVVVAVAAAAAAAVVA